VNSVVARIVMRNIGVRLIVTRAPIQLWDWWLAGALWHDPLTATLSLIVLTLCILSFVDGGHLMSQLSLPSLHYIFALGFSTWQLTPACHDGKVRYCTISVWNCAGSESNAVLNVNITSCLLEQWSQTSHKWAEDYQKTPEWVFYICHFYHASSKAIISKIWFVGSEFGYQRASKPYIWWLTMPTNLFHLLQIVYMNHSFKIFLFISYMSDAYTVEILQ